eukprot:Awhi_evm1s7318
MSFNWVLISLLWGSLAFGQKTVTYFTFVNNTRMVHSNNALGTHPGTLEECILMCEQNLECSVFDFYLGLNCNLYAEQEESIQEFDNKQYTKHVVDAFATIDGQWSPWTSVTQVSGDNCTELKTRTCTNPLPSNGGLECVGNRNETFASDCIEEVYSFYENLRTFDKEDVIGKHLGSMEQCRYACNQDSSCQSFDYNYWDYYCYLYSVNRNTRVQEGYNRYIKFVVDISKPVDGMWGAWSPWKHSSGGYCSNSTRKKTRKCDSPPPLYGGLNCSGVNFELAPTTCFYGLPDLNSYPNVFVEHANITSNSLTEVSVQMQINDTDINTCKQYALLRQSAQNYAMEFDHSTSICYIQVYDFYEDGLFTSNPNFTYFQIKNLPSPNDLPMPGPYVKVLKNYTKHMSSTPSIFNITLDLDNCKAQCLDVNNCLFIGHLATSQLCLIYPGNITESLEVDPIGLQNIYLLDRIWTMYPRTMPNWSARLNVIGPSVADYTIDECKRLCLYNHKCRSMGYNNLNQADSCILYTESFRVGADLFVSFSDHHQFSSDNSYYNINDLLAYDFEKSFLPLTGGRSVPFFSNLIDEITGYVLDCQRTCMGLNDCVAFDFTSYYNNTTPGRCYLQNATTLTAELSTADPTFYYYELDESLTDRVNQTNSSDDLQCPDNQECVGIYEKTESSRSQYMWNNIALDLGDVPYTVEECQRKCTDLHNCVAIDYGIVGSLCYLKSYSHPTIAFNDWDHYKLESREIKQTPAEGLSKSNIIIIVAFSITGLIVIVAGILMGLKIYKKKKEDLLDGMTPEEFVLQHEDKNIVEIITDEEYLKSKLKDDGAHACLPFQSTNVYTGNVNNSSDSRSNQENGDDSEENYCEPLSFSKDQDVEPSREGSVITDNNSYIDLSLPRDNSSRKSSDESRYVDLPDAFTVSEVLFQGDYN